MTKKTRVIAVVGPTSVGKTAVGIALAKRLGGEVISGDSRQVYRGLDLGTGKVTQEEADGIPHHLIDVADPREQFTAHDFLRLGRAAIAEIAARGKLSIVVGGTGLYIDLLLGRKTLDHPAPTPEVRNVVLSTPHEELIARLKKLDPKRYESVDLKNPRRVSRAVEIALSGSTKLPDAPPPYDVEWIGITVPLTELKVRIKARLHARLAAGMLDEARMLVRQGVTLPRMEELGLEYRYLARHLTGKSTYDEMVTELEKEITQYAKRQMTWFKLNKDIAWLTPEEALNWSPSW